MKEQKELQLQNVITVGNISKQFSIPHEKIGTVKGALVNVLRKNPAEKFYALKNVSFEIKKGEFFGIIGRNGSGKSTLLKILAGVYTADNGFMEINGRISPFLELGIGFNPELSGRDNIYLNATVLGLAKKEIDEKFDSIVAFSELERFIDQKIKNYSSGMQVRLAFSVAIHANREILLMDEVLAVGDTNFQSKCLEEFSRYKELGKTVILVSHDINTIKTYCDKAILLRNGMLVKYGPANDVVNEYIRGNIEDEELRTEHKRSNLPRMENNLDNPVTITHVKIFNRTGEEKNVFENSDKITIRIFYNNIKKIKKAVFGIEIYSLSGCRLFGTHTKFNNKIILLDEDNSHIDFSFEANRLLNGQFFLSPAIANESCQIMYDYKDRAYSFKINGDNMDEGFININGKWNEK